MEWPFHMHLKDIKWDNVPTKSTMKFVLVRSIIMIHNNNSKM